MIKLFSSTDKIYNSNGDKVITPLKAKVHNEDNGDYYLDFECDLSYINDIKSNKILVANTPQGNQAFRIGGIDVTRKKISLKAKHVYYDTNNYLIQDSYVVDKNCNDALDHLNTATDNASPFTTLSDITNINSFRCVRKSLNEAISTILERWGGHLVRDNWSIKIMSSIGRDNGVVIRYAKNLTDIKASYNWDNVVTKLLPVGKDGLLLDEIYVYSGTQYDIPYTKTVSFNQDINEDDYKDADGNTNTNAYNEALKNDLRIQAQKYVNENCNPQATYTLKANIDKITDVGDTVEVIDERLGINLTTNVISFDYDCIQERYTSIEFGNFKQKLSGLMSSISTQVDKATQESTLNIQSSIAGSLDQATSEIWGALGDSYCIYEGDKILIVDSLPKENARNCIMINNKGIGFSTTGIMGTFTSAWTIDGTLNMQAINVINLTANLIKGGTLKLGSNLNEYGTLEVYNESNTLISKLDKNGLVMYAKDGGYLVMNSEVGFAGYDSSGNKIYWVSHDEFHQKKSVVEEEITLCNKLRYIPITLDGSDGVGIVAVAEGGTY